MQECNFPEIYHLSQRLVVWIAGCQGLWEAQEELSTEEEIAMLQASFTALGEIKKVQETDVASNRKTINFGSIYNTAYILLY